MRNIEKNILDDESDGWNSWAVIHFYGFNKNDKGKYNRIELNQIRDEISTLDEEEIVEFHKENLQVKEANSQYRYFGFNNEDGTDIFRNIKTRKGQSKLRRKILENYNHRCALCKINDSNLLITSHIKKWVDSEKNEKIDTTNAILLCKLHDGLFENGYLSLSNDYKVVYSEEFDFDSQGISRDLKFRGPYKDKPNPKYLEEHRKNHGFS